MCTECSVLPDAFGWLACSAFFRIRLNGYDVKLVFLAFEWFVRKQSIGSCLCIFNEQSHFFLLVAFCQIGNMDAIGGVGCLMKCYKGSWILAFVSYQDVVGHYLMGECTHDFATVVAQVDGYINRVFRHGY